MSQAMNPASGGGAGATPPATGSPAAARDAAAVAATPSAASAPSALDDGQAPDPAAADVRIDAALAAGATSVRTVTARPITTRPGPLAAASRTLTDLWTWRHLVWAFTVYDIKHDKRNNILGNLWHLLNPVLNMLIFMFVVNVVFGSRVPDYPVFFFCGSMFFRAWTLAFGRGTSVLIQAAGLIKCCYFPRITVVAPVTIKGMYDLVLESLVLAVLMVIFGVSPGWHALLAIPFVLLTFVGASGAVLLLCCLGARFRDMTSLMQHVNRLFFYFSPVMYPVDRIPERFQEAYMLNPVSCALEIGRDLIVRNQMPAAFTTVYYSAFCLLLFAIGLLTFARLEGKVTKHL
ncbi:MAG: ABC transporter permease [Phycisphaerales bacterium]